MAASISEAAITMIEGFEICDPYNPRASWPGGASGITVAVGYDLGYASPSDLIRDWHDLVSAGALAAMQSCCGRKGASAQAMLHSVAFQIPYAAAAKVFLERDIPRYSAMTVAAFPNVTELSGDSFGALVSLVFNRGAGMTDPPGFPDSRLEMREIRDPCTARNFAAVRGLIRAMKRLWPSGLVDRREAEAALFERGLVTVPIHAIPASKSHQTLQPTAKNATVPPPKQITPDTDEADILDTEFNSPQGATP
jgi:GH24 family phage-related lysozyme (muramidase)